jgi:DNA-binding CsgD family transcriptional regulator
MPDGVEKADYLIEQGKSHCNSDFEQALLFLQEALVISTSINHQKGIAQSLLYQALAYYYKEELGLALNYAERSRLIFENLEDLPGLAQYHVTNGRIHLLSGNYLKATENFQEVVAIGSELNDNNLLYDGYCLLGATHLKRLEPLLAKPYLYEAGKIANDTGKQSNLFRMKADLYEQLEVYDSAIVFRNEVLKSALKSGHIRAIASSKYAKAKVLVLIGDFGEATNLLLSSFVKFQDLKDHTGICISALELFKAYHYTGNQQKSTYYEEIALNHATKSNNPNLLSYTFANLAPIKALAGKYQEAYQYLSKHDFLKDSLDKVNKERILKEMEVAFQTAKKDNEISLLKNKDDLQRKNIQILIISTGALLLSVILLVVLLRFKSYRMNRKYLLMEKEKTISDQEMKINEKEQLILKEQLEAKNRELGSKALEMLRINETLKEIIEKLEKFDNESAKDERTGSQLREISSGLEMQLRDNSWNEFEKIFNNIHSAFFKKLLETCPDLSPTEIKIAALLKLNLSTKEIAAITFKSEAGIKSARFRLRQKLGLPKDESLVPFLMQL